jgi:hypothetical protein
LSQRVVAFANGQVGCVEDQVRGVHERKKAKGLDFVRILHLLHPTAPLAESTNVAGVESKPCSLAIGQAQRLSPMTFAK